MLYGWEMITEKEKRLIAEGIKRGKALGGPYHLVLFPTDRCNLDCFFCYTEVLRDAAKELDWDILKKALAEGVLMGVKSVSLGGGGEPLIYRHLNPLFDFIEENRLKIDSIKTNGTALTEAVARRLLQSDLSRITISLNETLPAAYAKMGRCPEPLFYRAMEGIGNIVRMKKERASLCEISAQVFIWRENFERLPAMLETLVALDVDVVYVNTIDALPTDLKMTAAQKEEFRPIVQSAIERYGMRLQFNLSAEGLQQFAEGELYARFPQSAILPDVCPGTRRVEYCYIGWYAAVIEASGDIYSCCHFACDAAKSLGNLRERSLKEIWHGKRANAFRREMRHLLLTEADRRLLPRKARFIHPLCLERAACAFNYYLCDPQFYLDMENWGEPRRRLYKLSRRMKKIAFGAAAKIKKLLSGGQVIK